MTIPAAATKDFLDNGAVDTPAQALAELEALVDKFNTLRSHILTSSITSGSNVLGIGDGLESASGNLRAKLDGATLARSASGLKVADNAINTARVAHESGPGLWLFDEAGAPYFQAVGLPGQALVVDANSPTGLGFGSAGGGMSFVSTTTVSDAANLTITLPTTHGLYELFWENVTPETETNAFLELEFSFDGGSTWNQADSILATDDNGTTVQSTESSGASNIQMHDANAAHGKAVGEGIYGPMIVRASQDSGVATHISWDHSWRTNGGANHRTHGTLRILSDSVVDRLRFSFTSGNITGTIHLLGQDYPFS